MYKIKNIPLACPAFLTHGYLVKQMRLLIRTHKVKGEGFIFDRGGKTIAVF